MKKLLLAAVAASVAATGFAGSYAAPAAKPAATSNTYIELAGGYALTDYVKYNQLTASDYKHDNGGFAGGIDAGYTFMPHLGVEAGFMMPFQKTELAANTKNKVTQYSFYGAARIDANVGQGFNVFLLGGIGYTHQSDKTTSSETKGSALGFAGGFGADYALPDNFTIGAKYLRFAGSNKQTSSNDQFAAPQYFLVTLGYQISM